MLSLSAAMGLGSAQLSWLGFVLASNGRCADFFGKLMVGFGRTLWSGYELFGFGFPVL
jgi:hypothetical protein